MRRSHRSTAFLSGPVRTPLLEIESARSIFHTRDELVVRGVHVVGGEVVEVRTVDGEVIVPDRPATE